MKLPRKQRLNRYYVPYSDKNTIFERQIQRLQNDPIRYYDGANENVSNISIKGVRLG
jgi:hypothetical protein